MVMCSMLNVGVVFYWMDVDFYDWECVEEGRFTVY